MARLQPKLAKLQKQYANQPQLLRQKQAELQKEEKLHPLASCLPLIVTMVIFFVVFAGFRPSHLPIRLLGRDTANVVKISI